MTKRGLANAIKRILWNGTQKEIDTCQFDMNRVVRELEEFGFKYVETNDESYEDSVLVASEKVAKTHELTLTKLALFEARDRISELSLKVGELTNANNNLEARLAHRHILGKAYEVSAESINRLAGELDAVKAENQLLRVENDSLSPEGMQQMADANQRLDYELSELRTENAGLRDLVDFEHERFTRNSIAAGGYSLRVEELEAENAKLREELEKIAATNIYCCDTDGLGHECNQVLIARKALEGKK